MWNINFVSDWYDINPIDRSSQDLNPVIAIIVPSIHSWPNLPYQPNQQKPKRPKSSKCFLYRIFWVNTNESPWILTTVLNDKSRVTSIGPMIDMAWQWIIHAMCLYTDYKWFAILFSSNLEFANDSDHGHWVRGNWNVQAQSVRIVMKATNFHVQSSRDIDVRPYWITPMCKSSV
jgi:hypothetical protein